MRHATILVLLTLISCLGPAFANEPSTSGPWDLPALSAPPTTRPAPGIAEEGVQAIFYDAMPFQGKPTRVFAWVGMPTNMPAGKVPGIVLVHGGGGTAHARWVRLWNQRGYAAIAMDLCGKIPANENPGPRHTLAGPNGWDASFQQIDGPVEDQWPYHAVADVVLAHSLLRSLPQVDPDRIGITGISWGGYLTCIVAGVDSRFGFAAPIYGCGFLDEGSCWVPVFDRLGKEKAAKWLGLWDPAHYLPNARMPMLWVAGNVDFAYPLGSVQKSYRLPKGPRFLSIQPGMRHSHPDGEIPAEIAAFATQILQNGQPLARCIRQGLDRQHAWAVFQTPSPLTKALCAFTKDTGPWQKRAWTIQDATLDPATNTVSFDLPPNVAAFYLAVRDARGLLASSEHIDLPAP